MLKGTVRSRPTPRCTEADSFLVSQDSAPGSLALSAGRVHASTGLISPGQTDWVSRLVSRVGPRDYETDQATRLVCGMAARPGRRPRSIHCMFEGFPNSVPTLFGQLGRRVGDGPLPALGRAIGIANQTRLTPGQFSSRPDGCWTVDDPILRYVRLSLREQSRVRQLPFASFELGHWQTDH